MIYIIHAANDAAETITASALRKCSALFFLLFAALIGTGEADSS